MKKLIKYRREFPKIRDTQGRKEMAKEEFDAWHSYLIERRADLPASDFSIEPNDLSAVREIFDRCKVSHFLQINHLGQKNS